MNLKQIRFFHLSGQREYISVTLLRSNNLWIGWYLTVCLSQYAVNTALNTNATVLILNIPRFFAYFRQVIHHYQTKRKLYRDYVDWAL